MIISIPKRLMQNYKIVKLIANNVIQTTTWNGSYDCCQGYVCQIILTSKPINVESLIVRGGLGSQTGRGKNIQAALLIMAA